MEEDRQKEDRHVESKLVKRTSAPLNNQSFKKEASGCKVRVLCFYLSSMPVTKVNYGTSFPNVNCPNVYYFPRDLWHPWIHTHTHTHVAFQLLKLRWVEQNKNSVRLLNVMSFNTAQVQSAQSGTLNERVSVSSASPTFKKPHGNVKERANQSRNALKDMNKSNFQHETEDGKFFQALHTNVFKNPSFIARCLLNSAFFI